MKRLLLFILVALTLVSTADAKKKVKGPVKLVDTPRDMALQFAKSELKRFLIPRLRSSTHCSQWSMSSMK